jgi:predicted DNA-binding transcriptional regulator AlpA
MNTPTTPTPIRLGIADLQRRLGVSRTTILRWYHAGTFPRPHYLRERRSWFLGEIEAWEANRMASLSVPGARRGSRNLRGKAPSPAAQPETSTP